MGKTVLIADDHAVWRRGLREVLEPAFTVVSEVREGGEAVDQALALKPNVVVMDIAMPGMDGIAATRQIKQALPHTSVVIVSAADDDDQIFDCILAGVDSFVVKDDTAHNILEAVRHAAEGNAYLPPKVGKRILAGVAKGNGLLKSGADDSPLTGRETSVLKLMAQGWTHKQIARDLNISQRTVGNHVASIYNRLGICDRAEAIVYAIKKGIVRI